jgi:hypothetical protein
VEKRERLITAGGTMELEQVRLEFEEGRLQEVVIEPSPSGNGWRMLFKDQNGEMLELTEHSGSQKIFHSLDAATRAARHFGFETIHVEERF